MDCSSRGEGPAVLQLHKWDSSCLQLNLSEFREAFISPTRELLLLLTYQCEALLIPLLIGESSESSFLECRDGESFQISYQSELCLLGSSSKSDFKDDEPCPTRAAMGFDDGFQLECQSPKSCNYPFVFDVKSFAWGVFGDTYDQHTDVLYREFLFVCSSQGVIVHAFRNSDRISDVENEMEGDAAAQGRWMDWGSLESGQTTDEKKFSADESNRHGKTLEEQQEIDGHSRSASKRGLRSFFTKAETVKSEGKTWTRFPDKLRFPSSAKVVSFSIFDSDLPLHDFLSRGTSSDKVACRQESSLGFDNDIATPYSVSSSGFNKKSAVSHEFCGVGVNSLYECLKIFSSDSHQVIGFVFKLADSLPVDINKVSEGSQAQKLFILVARLDSWSIQWMSSVKLDEQVTLSSVSAAEWTDFCFSGNLLVCLNASGLIFFYDAVSGEFVSYVDIIQTCGLNHPSKFPLVAADLETKQFASKRMFRRLIVASYTSLLAAVDGYGIIYVVCARHVSDNYYSGNNFNPYLQQLGSRMLVGWEVSGFDIGHQKLRSKVPLCINISGSSTRNKDGNLLDSPSSFLCKDLHGCMHHRKGQLGFCLNGSCNSSKMPSQAFLDSSVQCHLMRKVFFPTNGHDDNDCIFFSSLGITRLIRTPQSNQTVHFDMLSVSAIHDDRSLNFRGQKFNLQGREESSVGEAVGCSFQGSFYLVTEAGISVVLPSVSVSTKPLPLEAIGYHQAGVNPGIQHEGKSVGEINKLKQLQSAWMVEVLDRVLLYEGPGEADRLCLENGWDLKISCMRRLQLALHYLNFDEVARSLEMLVGVNLAEEGILRLLFAADFLILHKGGTDNEVSSASRLLSLGTSFATKMIRSYGLQQHKNNACFLQGFGGSHLLSLLPVLPEKDYNNMGISRKLHEMSNFLEVIRNLQCQLATKYNKPDKGLGDSGDLFSLVDTEVSLDEPHLSILPSEAAASETDDGMMPSDTLDTIPDDFSDASALVPQAKALGKNVLSLENPKDMMARWKQDELDLKTVVKDALLSGRLPLAVLQLHLHHSRDFVADKESPDTFTEVRGVGRAIAYDLFLKGETGLAVVTLQRLGEDVESCLKQLLFGTIRRTLRMQVAEEMRRLGYLGPYEWRILERILLIERLYPSSSFWKTLLARQKELTMLPSTAAGSFSLRLLHSHFSDGDVIKCGEIDGVVLGSWSSFSEDRADHLVDEDGACAGYWAAGAVWSNAWDQRTIDRILLDQPFLLGVHVLWESKLEYYICHNDWEEVFRLLELIPTSVLLSANLQVALDGLQPVSVVECSPNSLDNRKYACYVEELDAVCLDIPGIKVFRSSAITASSLWLRKIMEQELARNLIFLKEYWEGTTEIVSLMARSGLITRNYNISMPEDATSSPSDLTLSSRGGNNDVDTVRSLHKLVLHHCVQHNLPNLLDLYLDRHMLDLDNTVLCSFLEAAGDCQWARWLLLSRIKGREYDASFSNSRSIVSQASNPDSNLSILDVDEIICTVDDIAEGGGEMAALATLMYAPDPIQKCLSSGSVKRHGASSAQCTLENLRPTFQRFPTLWRTLVTASLGQDGACNIVGGKANNVLSDYLNWRDNIFFSATRDTSLLQMLPCWYPKAVRRLIQLYIQGPLGWQTISHLPTGELMLHTNIDLLSNDEHTEISATSWEATIQKHVEEELYDSSIEENGIGLEHHLRRGRALAAFDHILGIRVQKLQSEEPKASTNAQPNAKSDVQTLLAPIEPNEESLLSFAIPLAITHFEDSFLVASCAFLLELCGLSASMLRLDIAALRRISLYYQTTEKSEKNIPVSKGSAFHAVSHEGNTIESLVRALAEEYRHQHSTKISQATLNSSASKQPSRALMLVLQHLENVSLPLMVDKKTCGSWLSTGDADGKELRSQQKIVSQHWNLVTAFCHMHQLPLSTKYLTVLARDNDWVGFLSEAQVGGYAFDTVIQVASKDFGDPRLQIHILTVLKAMYTRKKATFSLYLDPPEKNETLFDEKTYTHAELFRILAACEKQKNPGESLLQKAKQLSWSILAMIASCFPDVPPLSCLTVWLEITAARETSSIKVNDIASQISNNVGAAVEATNAQPAGCRMLTLHYNRHSPKRKRLMEPISVDPLTATSDVPSAYSGARTFSCQGIVVEERNKAKVSDIANASSDPEEGPDSLSKMVAVLCEQRLFVPLLRAFEMFLPSCSLLPFIRSLQAFSQMRLSEASAHLGSFSSRVKEEPFHVVSNSGRERKIGKSWISSTAVKAADATLSTCPSPYEKRCLLQVLAATDFEDGGSAASRYQRLYWKINLAEPLLRKDNGLHLGNETLDDDSLFRELENNGHWDEARNWARQLEDSGGPWKFSMHHVVESQAESMVAEWKEFLWDVPEERVALWSHCQTLFIRYSFPALQAGLFFLRHAEAVEKDIPSKELHELLLLSLQWLSGMITMSSSVYPLHLLREIETRVWLLAVESEAQVKSEGDFALANSFHNPVVENKANFIDRTATVITKMDNHINTMQKRTTDKQDREYNLAQHRKQVGDASSTTSAGITKTKRRNKGYAQSRRSMVDSVNKNTDSEDGSAPLNCINEVHLQDENVKIDLSLSKWEERVGPAELNRAILSLLEFGQISASKQLQMKLSPSHVPFAFTIVDIALKLAAMSTPYREVSTSMLDEEARSVVQSCGIPKAGLLFNPLQVLESFVAILTEGGGRGLCRRIIAVVKAANVLGLSFSETFNKESIELLQLLSLKAQDSFQEANLLVETHTMPASSIAQILAESFLKGLLAAHRGGYMDSQKEEGPAPLLWRFSDFLKWAELCPSEPEVGHALMRLVITGQEVPHACEVELLILSHHFYKSSACLDGVDVLVALAATRVEAYVSEGDFSCLARLITGVGNFHTLNFILNILVENGQLDLLLHKYSAAADANPATAEAVRGFRMAVLTSLQHFNPNDLDAFAMVYNHFDMKHETAALLESRAEQCCKQWFRRYNKDQNEDLLESMRYFIEAAEVHSSIDAGSKTRKACAKASLVSLQVRMPDFKWLNLSETNARRVLVEQSRFQEALIVAEAYGLNQPTEWVLVLWNQMIKPELTEEFVAEFVAVLPLQPSTLMELARFYRAEVAARGDQSPLSVWLTGGGLPADWVKYLGRSFRCLLKRTRDLRLRLQLATVATGFSDVVNACSKALDKVPDTAALLVLRKGHGGAYLPLM